MSAFKAGLDQLLPDKRQVVETGAEHVDTLASGDLAVETVLLCDLSEHDEIARSDLSARDARNNRIAPAFLNIRQIAIVRILDLSVLEDRFVIQRGKNGGDGGLAYLAAVALSD